MAERHSVDDSESTYSFAQRLRRQPQVFEEFAAGLQILARQADMDHPVEAAVSNEINDAAARVTRVYHDSVTWFGLATGDTRGRRDQDRYHQPRKGPRQETNADVDKAVRTV